MRRLHAELFFRTGRRSCQKARGRGRNAPVQEREEDGKGETGEAEGVFICRDSSKNFLLERDMLGKGRCVHIFT